VIQLVDPSNFFTDPFSFMLANAMFTKQKVFTTRSNYHQAQQAVHTPGPSTIP